MNHIRSHWRIRFFFDRYETELFSVDAYSRDEFVPMWEGIDQKSLMMARINYIAKGNPNLREVRLMSMRKEKSGKGKKGLIGKMFR